MMNSEIINRPYLENEKCQVVKLEYVNKQFESIVILPKETIDIETFVKDLDYNQYKNIITELKPVKVDLSLPKFKIEFGPSLKDFLVNLGVKKCFSAKAEFKGISKKADRLGDYFIIPSSIFEVIALRDDGNTDPKMLQQMVREVNETTVSPEEILSSEVYHVDQSLKISMACGETEKRPVAAETKHVAIRM